MKSQPQSGTTSRVKPLFDSRSLLSRSLAIVGFLLAIEIAFFTILMSLQQQAEEELSREMVARTIVAETNVITRTLYQTLSIAYLYKRVGDESYREVFERGCVSCGERLRSLKLLVASAESSEGTRREINQAIVDSTRFLDDLRGLLYEDIEASYEFTGDVAAADILNRKCLKLLTHFERLIDDQDKILRESSHSHLRAALRQVMVFGIVMNVGLAILLIVIFARGITKRLSIILDNTDRLANHQELNTRIGGRDEIAKLDGQFHQMSEKLAELDELKRTFVAMYSHDLRSPISSIRATLALLKTGVWGPLTPKAVDQVDRAERACDETVRMLTSMLDYEKLRSRTLEMEFASTNLRDMADRAIASLEGLLLQRQITVNLIADEELEIVADENWLVQTVVNLMANAIKFSPKNTTITVTVANQADSVLVRIADQGEGISQENIKKIFDRFQQATGSAKRVQGGYGLGLFVCKSVIEQHGGAIGVDSEEGFGSTFWFTLPKNGPQDS
ncbi:MAG: HAMP domain-containing histidine kinase [Candidatus Obscuribacterales bacterium]|nr:HAMP domain-containing histidine kinase [Candidatus Obscuribacterales bacterium]